MKKTATAIWTGVLSVWTVAMLMGSMSAGTHEEPLPTVSAERYELLDDKGQVRGRWFVDESNQTTFAMLGPGAKEAIGLRCGAGTSAMTLSDSTGGARLTAMVDRDGSTSLRLLGKDKQERIEISMQTKTGPTILLRDSKGQIRWSLTQKELDNALLELRDAEGKIVWSTEKEKGGN